MKKAFLSLMAIAALVTLSSCNGVKLVWSTDHSISCNCNHGGYKTSTGGYPTTGRSTHVYTGR